MKIQSLHINHFGHFAGLDLSFGDSGLAVLYGQNEAGKTTLLEFLRQLLFGFDERTPYGFGEGGEISGNSRLLLSDNRVVDLRRRKGRKNTVQIHVDGHETDLDETGIHRLLGHADKEVFKSIFAFGLDELRRGNEALSHESLQSALFGGGLGGGFNPDELLQDLDNQARELFKPSATNPSINRLSREISDLAKEVKAKAIRSNDYEARRQDWRDSQSKADLLSSELSEMRVRYSRTEKLAKALPLWLERRGLRSERDGLIVPSAFPNTALSQFRATSETIDRLTRERDQLQLEINDAQQKLDAIQLDKTLLPLKSEIIECHGLVKSVEEARRDLPIRRAERDAAEREVVATLHELRPGWSLETLRLFSLDAATQHAIQQLSERRTALNEELTTLSTRRESTRDEIARIDDELADLGGPRDVSALATIVEQSAEYTSDQKELKKESDARAKLALTLDTQRTKLSPPLPVDASDPQRLPVPPQEVAERFDREFRGVATKLATAVQSLVEEERALEQLERQWDQLEQQQRDVPKLEELTASRTRRDDGWRLIRSQYIDGEDRAAETAEWLGGGSQSLPDVFEHTVVRADQIADAIYEHADAVTNRKQLQQQIELARQSAARKREEVVRVQLEQQAVERRWNELWQQCGFQPLPPDAMRRWIDEHAALVTTHETLRHKEVELDSLRQRINNFETTFRAAINNANGEVAHSLATAKQQVKFAESEAEQRRKLERDRKRQQKAFDGIEAELGERGSREATWRTEWQAVLQRLELPTTWDTQLARNVIAGLSAAQAKLANLEVLSHRITAMEARINDFDPRVAKLCERLGESVEADRPEVIVKRLHERLTGAAQGQERRELLEQARSDTQRKLAAKVAELTSHQTRRRELLSLANAHTDAEFLSAAECAQRAVQLDKDVAQLTRDVELLRGNDEAAEFENHLRESDLSVLQAQIDDLQAELTRKETEANSAREAAGSMRRVFEELDGHSDAALLQEVLARKQAQLASEIHRYVPLVFAKTLLQQAIKRFERENQPEMIGSISKLFATMTGGRYIEIERPSSDRNAIYVRRTDGTELTPDQLSTGTREQLYLAIRLGYVLHYCRQAEPLPIVMDDVLVNFDDDRSRATLQALRDVSREVQVLFFTCHQHFVDLIGDVFPEIQPIELPTRSSGK